MVTTTTPAPLVRVSPLLSVVNGAAPIARAAAESMLTHAPLCARLVANDAAIVAFDVPPPWNAPRATVLNAASHAAQALLGPTARRAAVLADAAALDDAVGAALTGALSAFRAAPSCAHPLYLAGAHTARVRQFATHRRFDGERGTVLGIAGGGDDGGLMGGVSFVSNLTGAVTQMQGGLDQYARTVVDDLVLVFGRALTASTRSPLVWLSDACHVASYAIERTIDAVPSLLPAVQAHRCVVVGFDLREPEAGALDVVAADALDEVVRANERVAATAAATANAEPNVEPLFFAGTGARNALTLRNLQHRPRRGTWVGTFGGGEGGVIFASNVDDTVIGSEGWDNAERFLLRVLDELRGPLEPG